MKLHEEFSPEWYQHQTYLETVRIRKNVVFLALVTLVGIILGIITFLYPLILLGS